MSRHGACPTADNPPEPLDALRTGRGADDPGPRPRERRASAPEEPRCTVLLVDDDEDIRTVTGDILRQEGFAVQEATTGTEGLRLAAEHPDLIVLDVHLPDLDGFEVCRRLKTDPITAAIPVLHLSGVFRELDDRVRGLETGAAAYLTRPVDRAELLATIRTALRARHADARRRLADALAEVGRLLTQSLDPEIVHQRIADTVRALFDARTTILYRLEPASGDLVAMALAGDWGPAFGRHVLIPHGIGAAGRAARERAPVVSADILTDPRIRLTPEVRARVEPAPYRAVLAVPLVVQDRVIGVLALGDRQGRVFSAEEVRLAQVLADQAAVALENSRLYAEVRSTRDSLQAIAANSPDAIVTTDVRGRVTYFSPGAEAIFGYAAGEIVGRPAALYYRSGLEEARALMQRLRAEERIRNYETAMQAKDGRWLEVSASFSLLRDASGAIVGTLGVMKDVTERRHLEETLRQSQKMEAIGQLAGGVAHDFNNLLTVISGRSELLLAQMQPGDPAHRPLRLIKTTAERATTLTRQLLAFSRKQILQPTVLDVNAVVAGLETMLRRLIGEDIDLVTVAGPDLGHVKADPGQLEQVLMNLAVNARDAMPVGGQLTLETANVEVDNAASQRRAGARPGPYVRLAVSDSGVGMDAETRSHIFEPFFTTKGPDQGTGLGLATVYGIVTQSGGFIEVESAPGQGARFEIYLPRVDEVAERSEPPPARTGVPAGSETLVLAEDEEELRELAREILELQGYTVLEARHPSDALRIGEQHSGPIHLLVTDVVMPEMSGRELAERLTRSRPDMKVLYLTGYTDDAIVRHGVLAARVPLLQKPFQPDALAWKVREVLDQPRAGARPSHGHAYPETGKDGIGGRDAGHPPAAEPGSVTPRAPADATVRAHVDAPETHSRGRAVVPSPFPYVAIVRRGEVRLFEALRTMLEAQGIAEVIWDRRAGERRSRERPVPIERRHDERRRPPGDTWPLLRFVLAPRRTTDMPVERGVDDERGAHARTAR